ncbi:MAG: glycosyltransferase [Candidatus Colwellbacteria bacterium]|nr:glycosyltransferase [Candidatus Colwellbacteria bacterium]
MRVALVHDYLNQFGGAERVLVALSEMFPEAPIYTLFHQPGSQNGHFAGKTIKTSFLNNSLVHKNHRFFVPLMPGAANSINLGDKYDIIISATAGWAKGIRYSRGFHISYTHSPLRYAWEPQEYLGTLFDESLIKAAHPIISYLKNWDERMGLKPNMLLANSEFTADKVRKFYGRDVFVVHPPVDTNTFYYDKEEPVQKLPFSKHEYFLAFGRILHYKKFDLIVKAFNKLNTPLIILGDGPHREKVEQIITSPNIKLIGNGKHDDEMRKIISGARATIFPQVEDFGLTAAESIACGTPVIAYNKGGQTEIIEDGTNGVLFDEQSPEALIAAIEAFTRFKFNRRTVSKTAKKFSKENFQKKINILLNHANSFSTRSSLHAV